MKREFLEGLGLSKENVDSIMAEYGKSVQTLSDTQKSLEKERDDLKSQVDNASKEIQSYKDMDIESIKKSAADWETKYNDLMKSQEEARNKEIRNTRVNDFFKDVKFSSESAKAGVISQFNQKEFKYDEASNKFQGANEWLEEMKKNDAGAFLSDVANPTYTTNPGNSNDSASADALREAMGLSPETK